MDRWWQHARPWVRWAGKTTTRAMMLWGGCYALLHHDDHGVLLYLILLAVLDR